MVASSFPYLRGLVHNVSQGFCLKLVRGQFEGPSCLLSEVALLNSQILRIVLLIRLMLQEVWIVQKFVFVVSTQILLPKKLYVVGAQENRLQLLILIHFIYIIDFL